MNNKLFNVKSEQTIRYPRFKNPAEYLRNLSKKYGNKTVTYLEYILGLKDNTYSNLFRFIYTKNFTITLIKILIQIKNYNKIFDKLLDQSKCVTLKFDKKITCIRNKAIYFRILFYYFRALNKNDFAKKANEQFFYYFNKFLKLKKKEYSEHLVLNFLDIIFKDLFKRSFTEITTKFIQSQDTLKKHLTILIDIRKKNNKEKNINLISILNIIIRCKIKEIIKTSPKNIPLHFIKEVHNLNAIKKNQLINFIIGLQLLNENQKTHLIQSITNNNFTINQIQNMLSKFINVNLNHKTLSKTEQMQLIHQNWIKRYMINDNYDITETLSNGDCLFDSIKKAYESIPVNYQINMLREMVSNSIKENTYTKYKSFQELEGYKYMKSINNINQFKNYIKKKYFWADDYSINILEKILNMKLIIFSEKIYIQKFSSLKNVNYENTNVIKCTLSNNQNKNSGTRSNQEKLNPEYYIMVTYSGNHYRLITYENKSIFTFEQIPHEVKVLIVNNCMKNNNSGSFSIISKFSAFKDNLKKK